jgi:uncharacterized cupin superfamily protein
VADFVIKEWNLDPYPGDQAPCHVHYGPDEAFYVPDGELEVLEGDARRILTHRRTRVHPGRHGAYLR